MSLDHIFFRTSSKDAAGIGLQAYYAAAPFVFSANALQTTFLAPPPDRLILLRRACLQAAPGAGQNILNVQLTLETGTAGSLETYQLHRDPVALAANQQSNLNLPLDEIMWTAPYLIRMTANFNAGVAINNAIFWLFGYSVPRGYALV